VVVLLPKSNIVVYIIFFRINTDNNVICILSLLDFIKGLGSYYRICSFVTFPWLIFNFFGKSNLFDFKFKF